MARIRTIKPEFFTSESVGALAPIARLLYIGLWTQSDREGRLKFAKMALAAQIMPYEMALFDGAIDELINAQLIKPYEVAGKKYIYIPGFKEHQRPHCTEKASELPEYNLNDCRSITVKDTLAPREETVRATLDNTQERERERERERKICAFQRFYANYPRKKDKAKAERAWLKLKPDDLLSAKIMADIAARKNSQEWQKDNGRFIPYPATYLNNKRWEDEIDTPDDKSTPEPINWGGLL